MELITCHQTIAAPSTAVRSLLVDPTTWPRWRDGLVDFDTPPGRWAGAGDVVHYRLHLFGGTLAVTEILDWVEDGAMRSVRVLAGGEVVYRWSWGGGPAGTDVEVRVDVPTEATWFPPRFHALPRALFDDLTRSLERLADVARPAPAEDELPLYTA